MGDTVPPTTQTMHSCDHNQLIKIWWGTLKIDADGSGKQGIN